MHELFYSQSSALCVRSQFFYESSLSTKPGAVVFFLEMNGDFPIHTSVFWYWREKILQSSLFV